MLEGALQQRTLTALLLAPLAIAGVLLLPTAFFALALGSILLLGAWEWASLGGMTARASRLTYVSLAGITLLLLWYVRSGEWVTYAFLALTLWWCGAAMMMFRKTFVGVARGLDAALLGIGLVVLGGAWLAIVHLHGLDDLGPWLALFFFLLIWTTDTAAYFVGRKWGRAKLAPVLSPGKTWAGVYGAFAGASMWGLILGWGLGLSPLRTGLAVAVCVLTAGISVIGDLYESLLKRRRGLKDAGHLLPGHGGVLDRIDSLMAAAPVFTLGILWLGVHS